MKKKIILSILTALLALSSICLLSACNTPSHTHAYSSEWSTDGTYHWHECECGAKKDIAEHIMIDNRCSGCQYVNYSQGLLFGLFGDNTYSVEGIGFCTDEEIIIPATFDDKPVTRIGVEAFYGCDFTSIIIPDSVTYIGSRAFSGCDSLTNIEVSAQNANYKDIDGNLYSKDGTTLIQYAMGKTATSFTIPDSVTSIVEDAFHYCTSLTSIVIPDSVTSIGFNAFDRCDSLTIYCEPTARPSGWLFYDGVCPVVWDCNNNEIADDGCIYTIIDGVRYALKDGIATVVKQPSSLTTANIKSSIEYKGVSYAVTSIGNSAFRYCTSLTSIVISDSVTSIGYNAFDECDSLTSIVIPESVTYMSDAFGGCVSLTIYCEATEKPSDWDSNFNYYNYRPIVWDCNNNDVATDGYIYTVIDGVRYAIKDGVATVAKQPRSLTTANIKSSIEYKGVSYAVTSIGNSAFEYCRSLTSIVIPDSVTSIGDYAFSYCDSLTSIVIPDSVTSIGDFAFYRCDSLTSIIIPDSVTSIGEYAFYRCDSLTIYCEAESEPSGWDGFWNYSGCPVVWAYKG